MRIRPIHLFLIFFLILAASAFAAEKSAEVMGTTVRVEVAAKNAADLSDQALDEIRRLEKLFSRFDPASEISMINRLAGEDSLQVSPDTFKVIETAKKINELSRGAFDITLGHPEDLLLDKKTRKVYLRRKGIKIDLGGIGKGYAVDSARGILLKRGVRSAIIDMHSSIAVIGDGWGVGVLDPKDRNRILGTVILNNGDALSTSGQYEQPGHIIDPRTGKPADKCLSVTVITQNAALADALSTAIFILSPSEGMKTIKLMKNVSAVIVDKSGKVYDNFGFKLR
jgi:thiamine biosynthesis lipoprotein